VWGKEAQVRQAGALHRIIPTRVGKSLRGRIARPALPDHPHACGEKRPGKARLRATFGSSPRVWGKERRAVRYEFGQRIIPTRVGKREQIHRPRGRPADHPHACGEKAGGSICPVAMAGSSPRVWGKDWSLLERVEQTRIIPTRVGKRDCPRPEPHGCTDHPHACGEKRRSFRADRSHFGSSPRVWGKVYAEVDGACKERIIPTRVGKRARPPGLDSEAADHPHACGEKIGFRAPRRIKNGSSPRVWGKVV